jgi:hypothetical protein
MSEQRFYYKRGREGGGGIIPRVIQFISVGGTWADIFFFSMTFCTLDHCTRSGSNLFSSIDPPKAHNIPTYTW